MKSANALVCVPKGDGELSMGSLAPAILIGDLPPPSRGLGFHAKVGQCAVCRCCRRVRVCRVEKQMAVLLT